MRYARVVSTDRFSRLTSTKKKKKITKSVPPTTHIKYETVLRCSCSQANFSRKKKFSSFPPPPRPNSACFARNSTPFYDEKSPGTNAVLHERLCRFKRLPLAKKKKKKNTRTDLNACVPNHSRHCERQRVALLHSNRLFDTELHSG